MTTNKLEATLRKAIERSEASRYAISQATGVPPSPRSLDVSERLKGASARRFERGQFDRKGMVHSDSGFLRKPSTGVGPWYVVWIWTKRRELSSYSLQG